jgi:hypothetical protein
VDASVSRIICDRFVVFVMFAEGEVLNTCVPHSTTLDHNHTRSQAKRLIEVASSVNRNTIDGLNLFEAVAMVYVSVDKRPACVSTHELIGGIRRARRHSRLPEPFVSVTCH